MIKWEYKTVSFDPLDFDSLKAGENTLNDKGSEGWEIATSFFGKTSEILVVLKRPK